ncbi:MAG: Ig-like domain-containing protein [Gemmatimonadales bacterium]
MNKFHRSLLLTGIVAAGLAGCGDDVTVVDPPPPPPPPPPSVSVTVGPDGVSVSPGQTIQMAAAVTQDAGCAAAVTWSVSDAARASVSTSGLVSIAAAAASGPVAVRATATCATGGASANGVATLNVVGTTATGVTVTPATATLNAGTSLSAPQTVQLAAAVTGTNNPAQTVTWTSLDPVIATVSSSGLVTANNAATPGNVVMRACSTVNPNACGTSAIVVIVPDPASVQIQAVTFNNGTTNVPVNLVNVFGQIEIALNVESGSRNITRVDALIGGQVVATQTFTSAAPAAAPDAPETAPTLVVLSTATTQLRQSGGIFVPVVFNGNSAITANLYVAGSSTPIASNAVPVVMNNPDAVVRTSAAALTATSTTPSAVNGGNTYFKGTQSIAGYNYIGFGKATPATVTLTSTTCGVSGNLIGAGSATSGLVLAGTYACAAVQGSNTVTETPTTTYAVGAVGPDGTPLVAPVGVRTVGSAFQLNSESRWNMIAPAVGPSPGPLFVDNLAPTVTIGNVAFNDLFDQPWVNGSYAFAQDLGATDIGGSGVAGGFPVAREYIGIACTSTNLPTQTGADFAETVTSNATDGKRICTYAEDQLGNGASSGASNYFGIDKVAPAVRIAGSTLATPAIGPATVPAISSTANTTIWSIATMFAATDAWGVEGLDTRSGFNQNAVPGFPAQESMQVLNPANNPASTFTAQSTFTCGLTNPLSVVLSDNYVRSAHLPGAAVLDCGLGTPMYVWVALNATDRAGNAGTAITRNYAIDQYAAPVLASIGASTPLYTAGLPANFFLFGSDDLEIIEADLAIGYPNIATVTGTLTSITKPLSAIAGAQRWDNALTNILTAQTVTDPFFFGRVDFTCTGAAAPYASCAVADGKATTGADYNNAGPTFVNDEQNPTAVSAVAYDVASQASGLVTTALLTAQTTDVAQQWSGADLVTWRVLTPTGTTVQAEHKASTSIVVPYFDAVYVVRGNIPAATSLIVCGAAPAPTLTDNGVNRFWTYTFTKASSGPCFTATGSWGAIGAKAAAGLVTQLVP